MLEGDPAGPRRLPFRFEALGGVGRLALESMPVGPLIVDRLELEVTDLGTDPGAAVAERYQRRRTRLRSIAMRITASRLDERLEQVRRHLAGLGVSQINARLNDGFISIRARAADGLAAADLSFRIHFVSAGTHLRALASTVRVHGHLPTPGPLIADRILVALFGATDAPNVVERPHARGLCDVEIDLVGALLWHMLPPSGWRLPSVSGVELVGIRIGRSSVDVAYGPAGTRSGELGVRPLTHQLAAAHDLMHSADQELREGHYEEAMRGYRALLAAGGPEQPLLLERILSLAAARPAWFFDGLELSRQALGRWPHFPAAHAALASIMLAQGDAREAAGHLTMLAQLASGEGDDDQAALAALSGARLLRVLEPKAATQLYELALEHDPSSLEAADSLVDRLADEHRWPELVRLVRARAVITAEPARAVQLRLRLADVFIHQLGDPASAQHELAVARELAPDDPSVHEMAATVLATIDPPAAIEAWREVARLAEARGDHRTASRAWAILGDMLTGSAAEDAWARALALDPLQSDALAGLATAAAARGDHDAAADLYERLRGLGLPQHVAARYELELARSLVATGRVDDARASLRRATLAGGETAAEAHAVLAEVAEATSDREHAAAELDTAIASLIGLASDEVGPGERLYTRAAQLAVARAHLLDRSGLPIAASADWIRAHDLANQHAPEIARDAARTLLARSGQDAGTERRWIDAVLATRPPPTERAGLLVRRAEVRRREQVPDIAAAIADLHEALQLTHLAAGAHDDADADDEANEIRRRAYRLEAELLSQSGDRRARAQALTSLAKMAERNADRVQVETAAAAAWLAADEPGTALPHGARAHAELGPDAAPTLRREVLVTLGEAAWRQRAWPDVIRAYTGLLEDPGPETEGDRLSQASGTEPPRVPTFRYRLAVAADRSGDQAMAVTALRPLVEDPEAGRGSTPEVRAQVLRLFADLAERSGDLAGAATALEGFAALADDSSPTARADAMYRAGELFRRADRGEDAIRCLEAALRISDTHMPALDALETEWRARGDIERVSVILGRKVAATARHPARQKPLLSRLGDLQEQLGRPEVALAAHQRALEIDPSWRPSLRYVTLQLQAAGQLVAAAGGLAQLSAELPGDTGVDLAIVARERHIAAGALSELVAALESAQLDAIRELARPALERAHVDGADVAAGLAKLRGEAAPSAPVDGAVADSREENTASGRASAANGSPLSLRDAATRSRLAGKLDDAFATLETANHVNPGDVAVLQELVELATETGDHAAAARHLSALAERTTGPRRGNALLELAEIYYDRIDDAALGRDAMRRAADAFASGSRRDATLRMLASEARGNLAWDVAVEALSAVVPERRTAADVADLAAALLRAGRDGDALTVVEQASAFHRFDDGGALLATVRGELERKALLARALEERAGMAARAEDANAMRQEAAWLRAGVAESRTETLPGTGTSGVDPAEPPPPPPAQERRALARIKLISVPADGTVDDAGWASVSDPRIKSGPVVVAHDTVPEVEYVSPEVAAAAEGADRPRLIAAHRADPDDAGVLLAVLVHLAKEPVLRREILEEATKTSKGQALAIALHELALLARENHNVVAATTYWTRAHEVDPSYAPVWMPLADALAASDELATARELYEQVAQSDAYDDARRSFAADRAAALGHDDAIVSGEIGSGPRPPRDRPELAEAQRLADAGDLRAAITLAENIAAAAPSDGRPLELLESLYFKLGDVTAASEAIGRQLVMADDEAAKGALWRRRAKLYRDSLNRDAEAYRCLKEAHACSPADPEIAYQLRTAAMVRGEWALAASLLYREIAAAPNPRDRGALHLELALIFDERLDDDAQAQVNFEQALAFDPTIPAAKLPLARRYETTSRFADAAKLYEEAAATARAAERGSLLEAAARCRTAAGANDGPDTLRDPPGGGMRPNFEGQLVRAETAGDLDAVLDIATQLWRADAGNPFAFRVLAKVHRASGDLPALSDLTSVRASRAETADERAAAWLEVARLAEELGALDQAARAYDLALAEDPSHIGARDARGSLAFSLGDYATADTIYRDLGPGDSVLGADELALRRSIISEKLGRDTEALTQAQEAAVAAPNRRDVMMRVQELATRIGDLDTALAAARSVLDLVPLDDEEASVVTQFAIIDLLRQSGNLDGAIVQLGQVLRDHPHHGRTLETLAEIHSARGDWPTATRYLYQLVPLATSPQQRAERLYQLGEAVLVHLGDVDRADDVFLRASDLDPGHVPTLRRLLDVYWRSDDPGALVEVATELAEKSALVTGLTTEMALAHALVAAALLGDAQLAATLGTALGDEAPRRIATALGELTGREGRLQLATASTAIAELARRGLLDLAKVRAAAAGTPVASLLTSS